jgi:hypothetical protein
MNRFCLLLKQDFGFIQQLKEIFNILSMNSILITVLLMFPHGHILRVTLGL